MTGLAFVRERRTVRTQIAPLLLQSPLVTASGHSDWLNTTSALSRDAWNQMLSPDGKVSSPSPVPQSIVRSLHTHSFIPDALVLRDAPVSRNRILSSQLSAVLNALSSARLHRSINLLFIVLCCAVLCAARRCCSATSSTRRCTSAGSSSRCGATSGRFCCTTTSSSPQWTSAARSIARCAASTRRR